MKNLKLWLMFVLVLGYGSVIENFFPILIQLIELFLLFLIVAKTGFKPKGKYGVYFIIIYSCVFVSALVTSTSILRYSSFLVRPIIALFILSAFGYDYLEIKNNFAKVLQFHTKLSFVNFFVATIFGQYFMELTSNSDYTVHTLGFVFNYIVAAERLGLTFARNQGMFWEPGVLAILMNMYVFILLFDKKVPLKKVIFPIFVIFTTASTSGYLVLMALLALWYLKSLKESNKSFSTYFKIIISAILVAVIVIPIVMQEVTYKTTEGRGSTDKREFDFLMGMIVAADHPFFGIGPNKDLYLTIQNKYQVIVGINDDISYDSRPNSNLFSMLFALYGIPMALLYLLALYKQNIFRPSLPFFMVILIALMSEPVAFIDLFFLWIMSGSYKPKGRYSFDEKETLEICNIH